jgi:hypothetical protein
MFSQVIRGKKNREEGEKPFWISYSLPARKSSFFIHRQGVDVVQEVANLFGKQQWRAWGKVQFDSFSTLTDAHVLR